MRPQSVLDALADAETLRLAVALNPMSARARALREAQNKGADATGWERQEDAGRYRGWPFADMAAAYAKAAARAAFKAVPALRGE